jgi:hypothetical protein
VLEYGAYVALGLLAVWIALLIPLTSGKLKTISFGAASMFLALMIPFFWLGPETTELTILKVGSFKTNAEQASRYFDEIKAIRSKVEAEDKAISTAVASLNDEIAAARAELQAIKEQLADRILKKDQIDSIADDVKAFSPQQFEITTYWEDKECMAISKQIHDAITQGGWEFLQSGQAHMLLGGVIGVRVYVNPKADDKTKKAANALIAALNESHLNAELREENDPEPNNRIHLNVGAKR